MNITFTSPSNRERGTLAIGDRLVSADELQCVLNRDGRYVAQLATIGFSPVATPTLTKWYDVGTYDTFEDAWRGGERAIIAEIESHDPLLEGVAVLCA